MDTVTHGFAGYIVAKTGLTKDTGRWGVIAGVTASLFPDVDNLVGGFFGTEFVLRHHRGLTNSIFLVVPFSLLFAWLFTRISGKRRFWTFFVIWLVEILIHTFLDLITSFGTMILSPLSTQRFALDWVFIIDLFLTGILFSSTIAVLIWRNRSRTIARISVTLAALYISICAGSHFWALSLAENHARERGLHAEEIASLPQPLSPFHWANYVVTQDKIYKGLVRLIGTQERDPSEAGNFFARVWAKYQPTPLVVYEAFNQFDDSPWVKRALTVEGVETFLWFARFPIVRDEGAVNGQQRVTFFDLRFGSVQGRKPFLYEVIFNEKGDLVANGFQRDNTPKKD
ncbi:MAG: metal-dependent hydrolase [Deltaproteobacteria bacterium]|nr:MAG: metal-dependent hydrolase [Deltaproteobacteria bacterium]